MYKRQGLTGLVLTKLDGDSRGGSALSVVYCTGKPIKLTGTGEKLNALEAVSYTHLDVYKRQTLHMVQVQKQTDLQL